MSPALWRLLTQASREPAPFVLGLAMLAGFVSVLSEPLAWIPAAAAFVMLLQMLRVLWRRSRVLTFTLAVGLPALVIFMTPGYRVEASLFLMFVPAILATVLEALSRRAGGFLKAAPVPEKKPEEPRSKAQGCRNLAILAGLFFAFTAVFFVWSLNVPGREAHAFKQRIRPGMRLSEVVIASLSTGRHIVRIDAEEGAPALRIGNSAAFVADDRAETPGAIRALLDRRAPELRLKSLSFMFLSSVPVRSSILVRFGPGGTVTAVEGPFNWAS
ncbi:MAG: hypothetical protein KBH14_05430 [Vicinamibacteria bacterium]|nr:hypothetical protein [Vicinamibacteria bacterium]